VALKLNVNEFTKANDSQSEKEVHQRVRCRIIVDWERQKFFYVSENRRTDSEQSKTQYFATCFSDGRMTWQVDHSATPSMRKLVDRQEWVPLAELGERALMGQGLERCSRVVAGFLAGNPVRWTGRGEFSKRDRAAIDHRRSVFQSEFCKHIDARAAGDAFAEADR